MTDYTDDEGMGSEWVDQNQETDEPIDPVKEQFEEAISKDPLAEHEPPIEKRASEAELLYANLLLRTDFERSFIEEMLEFKPDEQSRMRIDELCRKQREIEEAVRHSMPPTQTTTIMI